MLSNLVKGRIGINAVSRIVEVDWECGWQEYAAQNDNAIDGTILMRRGSKEPSDTGGIVFVQVKTGGDGYRKDQKKYPHHIGVSLGKRYVAQHRSRWAQTPGPAVLVFVDDTKDVANPPAWWTDLKLAESYSPTNQGLILVPKSQRFARHTKGIFHKLCGSGNVDRQLIELRIARPDMFVPKLGKGESLRNDAWEYYKEWRGQTASRINPSLGEILVNRIGWKHSTRMGRLPERIVQSWLLLDVAKKMIVSCKEVYTLGHASKQVFPDGNIQIIDYVGLRAKIVFTYRHPSIIQVVLRRSRLLEPRTNTERQKIWFYSVYELRRGTSLS